MDQGGTPADLRILAPQECVWWGIETEYDGKWKRRTLAPGRQGPRERFWHIDRLTEQTVRSLFGAGTHRLLYYRANRRGQLGTSRPLVLAEGDTTTQPSQQLPDPYDPTLDELDELDDQAGDNDGDLAQQLAGNTGGAWQGLDAERLAAVLQGRPADTQPLGVAMGMLERLNALYLSMNQAQFAQLKHEAALQVARARAEVELVRAQERERANGAIEQSRMFFERTAAVQERAHQIEADAREGESAGELEALRESVQQLQEAFAASAAGSNITVEQEDVLSSLIRVAGPDVLKQLAARFLNGGVVNAAGWAQNAAAATSVGDVIDAVSGAD